MGYKIKDIREKIGMTQTQLSEKSGVSRATIWALESGENKITTTKTLAKIAEAMNVTIDSLLCTDHTA